MNKPTIEEVLAYLDKNEIDYRLESNFCCGYVFYFLDGSVYPRRYMDCALEGEPENIVAESVENMIEKALSYELKKDWRFRIEGKDLANTFKQAVEHLRDSEYFTQPTL